MEYYNSQEIIRISVYKECVNSYYEYRKERKHFFRQNEPEGFYKINTWSGDELFDIKNLDNTKFVKDNIVYTKPYVYLTFKFGKDTASIHIYCDTYQQAIDKANEYNKLTGNKFDIIIE